MHWKYCVITSRKLSFYNYPRLETVHVQMRRDFFSKYLEKDGCENLGNPNLIFFQLFSKCWQWLILGWISWRYSTVRKTVYMIQVPLSEALAKEIRAADIRSIWKLWYLHCCNVLSITNYTITWMTWTEANRLIVHSIAFGKANPHYKSPTRVCKVTFWLPTVQYNSLVSDLTYKEINAIYFEF